MNTIKESWRHYRLMTLPPDAKDEQVLEAKLGFYSGAASMYWKLAKAASNPDITQEQGTSMFNELGKEVDQFGDTMTPEGLFKFMEEEI